MNSQFQGSDRLRDILQRARARSEQAPPAPPAQERAQAQASVESLLDRDQPLPDPRALSRLYQEQALTARLPDSLEAEAEAQAGRAAPGWGDLPAPAPPPRAADGDEAPPPPVWVDQAPLQQQPQQAPPALSAAEIRNVMYKLQSEFGGSYALYEIPNAPTDDAIARTMQDEWDAELAELKRLADESVGSNWVFVVGALVVVVVLGAFIYLAAAGPLKAPPTPAATPSTTASAAHH